MNSIEKEVEVYSIDSWIYSQQHFRFLLKLSTDTNQLSIACGNNIHLMSFSMHNWKKEDCGGRKPFSIKFSFINVRVLFSIATGMITIMSTRNYWTLNQQLHHFINIALSDRIFWEEKMKYVHTQMNLCFESLFHFYKILMLKFL